MSNQMCAILNLIEDETKLKPLTDQRPIASLPFASRYRLIDFQLTSLYGAEITSAALFIQGSGHSLYDHMRSGSSWGLDSRIGGGVFTHSQLGLKGKENQEAGKMAYFENQRKYVKKSRADYVVLMGSQMLCNLDLTALLRYHKEKGAAITTVYKTIPVDRVEAGRELKYYEFAEKDGNDLVGIHEVNEEALANKEKIAIRMRYEIVRTDKFLEYLDMAEKRKPPLDAGFLSEYALEAGDKVSGYEYTGYLKDVDTVKAYFEANMDMLEDANYNALFYRNQPVITKTKNGAPTYYAKKAQIKNALIATDCIVSGKVENTIIFRKVEIKDSAKIRNSIIMQDSRVAEGAELNYVILDKNVHIGPNVKLEGTAEKPLVIKKNEVVNSEKGA